MWIDDERLIRVDGVELAYQELGDPDGEPMVLVMGLGMQLIHWQLEFCELLAAEGFRVIRFDNRDAGRSTKFSGRVPSRAAMMLGLRHGLAYPLDAMADDTAGLIEALGHESAHIVGVSQGGMIAQVVGYRHPHRALSLGLIMTGSGKRVASVPRLRALGALLMRSPRDRDAFADFVVRTFRVIGSAAYPADEDELRRLAREAYDRGHYPAGVARQLHAITASGDRSRNLRGVRAPTMVIHGTRDPLVRPAAGRSVAEAIPGAELRMIEGMAHDLPRELWPEIADALVANARRARTGVDIASAAA
jgi:pimeloyl-ACP methyl ester carboxylesterase